MKTLPATALLLLFFVATGCDTRQKNIVGKWKVEGAPSEMVWEFLPNGSVKSGTRPGKYSFGDGGRLKIQTQVATFIYGVEFPASDRMIWREPNGTQTKLRKVE
ncbi:MAG: hypothetical protein H0V56_11445 [Chthoniobacterales bacterium]|nr:hypothetical protein [Chthoniobacterales bacterium]